MKNMFCILIVLVLSVLSCSVGKEVIYENGNYYFKYLGNKAVCFCGWSKEAIKQSKGIVYVPEKIYDFDVVEVGISYTYSKSQHIYPNEIKLIVTPANIKTVRLDMYSFDKEYLPLNELYIPEGITDISAKALEHVFHEVDKFILPRSLKRIDYSIFHIWSYEGGKTVTFQDTANWYVKKEGETSWQLIDVSNPSINAENLTKKYSSYIWEKRP